MKYFCKLGYDDFLEENDIVNKLLLSFCIYIITQKNN